MERAVVLCIYVCIFFSCCFFYSEAGVSLTVKNGYLLPNNKFVGTYTSQLQKNVLNALYPTIQPKTILATVSLVNSSVLRYLNLEGAYFADAPLVLPSLFILNLTNGVVVDANNITNSLFNGMPHVGLITLNKTKYSAVIGGIVNATTHNTSKMLAVSVLNSERNTIRSVRALSNFQTSIGVHGGSQNEIANCEAGGDEGYPILGRAIWLLATSKCYVHHCHVHHSLNHALDFDAYTSSSIAYNNLCEDNKDEGIFVEETAHDNVIASNTCRRNFNGIGVYSNVVGPVKGNVFFGNIVEGNHNSAITAGGVGHDHPDKHSDSNTFFANIASNIPLGQSAFNPMHGNNANVNDYWFSNEVKDEGANDFFPIPKNNANIAIFQP
eukprot:g2828.t1